MGKPVIGKALVEQIIGRITKGYASRPGTKEENRQYYSSVQKQVRADYANLVYDEFETKYAQYIDVKREELPPRPEKKPKPRFQPTSASKDTEMQPRIRGHRKLQDPSPEDQERTRIQLEEDRIRRLSELRENNPPNTRFFSFTAFEDESWCRLDMMPTLETLERKKAIKWTGGMIGCATNKLGSFAVIAIHHGGRVIEFEYLYDEAGESYNPHF
ncbi:MAG: hypothetical protein ABWX90_00885 [Candidatus Saccharimonadales bacterium]